MGTSDCRFPSFSQHRAVGQFGRGVRLTQRLCQFKIDSVFVDSSAAADRQEYVLNNCNRRIITVSSSHRNTSVSVVKRSSNCLIGQLCVQDNQGPCFSGFNCSIMVIQKRGDVIESGTTHCCCSTYLLTSMFNVKSQFIIHPPTQVKGFFSHTNLRLGGIFPFFGINLQFLKRIHFYRFLDFIPLLSLEKLLLTRQLYN